MAVIRYRDANGNWQILPVNVILQNNTQVMLTHVMADPAKPEDVRAGKEYVDENGIVQVGTLEVE